MLFTAEGNNKGQTKSTTAQRQVKAGTTSTTAEGRSNGETTSIAAKRQFEAQTTSTTPEGRSKEQNEVTMQVKVDTTSTAEDKAKGRGRTTSLPREEATNSAPAPEKRSVTSRIFSMPDWL